MLKEEQNKTKHVNVNTHAVSSGHDGSKILFKITTIVIYGTKNNLIKTYAFIDEGSSVSIINEHLIDELQLTGVREPLYLKWTTDVGRNEGHSRKLNIQISGPNKKVFLRSTHCKTTTFAKPKSKLQNCM